MYEGFYGLTNEPFKMTLDPKFLYLSKKHEEGLAYLQYGVERKKGLIVLTGEVGTGKTALLKTFVQRLDTRTHTAFLVNTPVSPLDIYKHTFHELGIGIPVQATTEWDFFIPFKDFLEKCSSAGENCILIVDEAQRASLDVLEQLRLFLNFETDEEKLIQIILIGHSELHDKLNLPESAKLQQHISITYNLLPLDYAETKDYVEKRLAVAGAVKPLFTADAIREIYRCSNGIPRRINIIGDLALLHGFREKLRVLGRNAILYAEAMLSFQGAGGPHTHSAAPARDGGSADTLNPTQADFLKLSDRPGTTGQPGDRAAWRGAWWPVCIGITAGLFLGLVFDGGAVRRLERVKGAVEKFTQSLWHASTAESSPPQGTSVQAAGTPAGNVLSTKMFAVTLPEQPVPMAVETRAGAADALVVPLAAPPVHEEAFVAVPQPAALVPPPVQVIQYVTALVHQFFPDGGAFTLHVQPDKGTDAVYTAGDKLSVDIVAASDVYLQVDYYQADGQVVHLLPNALDTNYVEGGETFTLGKPGSSFQFTIAPPFGVEMLVVIASQQPLDAQGDVPAVEPASRYLERLARSLEHYQATEQVAVAYTRIRTQEPVDTR